MNELYQKLLSSLPPNGQEEFKNAQRAWVKSRNHSAATEETTTESHVSTLADHEVAVPDPRPAQGRYDQRSALCRIRAFEGELVEFETIYHRRMAPS